MLSDLHRHPFSLFTESRLRQGGCDLAVLDRVGEVKDVMDKAIGRPCMRIEGQVSANNYIEFKGLNLTGKFVHIQMQQLNRIATLHLELITSNDKALRISLSTIYSDLQPRNLGASIRIPMPLYDGWMVLVLDIDEIIKKYCGNNVISNSSDIVRLKSIRSIQLCSNLLVRDVVTSDKILSAYVPKELAIKAQADVELKWINISDLYDTVAPSPNIVDRSVSYTNATTAALASRVVRSPNEKPAADIASPINEADTNTYSINDDILSTDTSILFSVSKEKTENVISRRPLSASGTAYPRSPLSVNYSKLGLKVSQDDSLLSTGKVGVNTPLQEKYNNENANLNLTTNMDSSNAKNNITTNTSQSKQRQSCTPSGSIVRPTIPETSLVDRVLSLERILGYSGGSSLLLYEGKMIVVSSGSLIVLIDVDGTAQEHTQLEAPGLWRAFKNANYTSAINDKYKQAFLRGHSNNITLLEVSANHRYMISCDGGADGTVFLWDLHDGKKVLTLKPHSDSIQAVAISPDNSMLVTVGTDNQRRLTIITWDLQLLLMEKGAVFPAPVILAATAAASVNPNTATGGLIIARQLSDFHINKIAFSPFEEYGLVTCGRENIRFWRMRKGHLPGRPVHLNEFSRLIFNDIAFYSEPGAAPKDPRRPCVYVSSNKGLLLKIDSAKEQVICSYQLHSCPIRSLAIRSGYAVTGGEDSKLRVWPLDFSDFLLEAHHEASVTSIATSKDGRKLCVGTSSGTLGVLDISEHSYTTILRSHVGPLVHVASRGSQGPEFATIGQDSTIRLWDLMSAQQKFEFSSPIDGPLCSAYHPVEHLLAVGFDSGTMRLFDVQTTTTIIERKQHSGAIVDIIYAKTNDNTFLITAGLDGNIVIYDADNSHEIVKCVNVVSGNISTLKLALSRDQAYLAIAASNLASIVVYHIKDFTIIHKGITSPATPANNASPSLPGTATVKSWISPADPAVEEKNRKTSFMIALDSLTNGGANNIPVTGIAFCDDKPGMALIVTTDKHIISLPLDLPNDHMFATLSGGARSSTKKKVASNGWDEKLVRRIDFGTPRSMARDAMSGVLFMAVKAPSKSVVSNDDTADSLVIVDARHKTLHGEKLSLSAAQMYQDQPGSIVAVCPLTQYGKVISIDNNGSLTVWNVKFDRLQRMSDGQSPAIQDTPLNNYTPHKVDITKIMAEVQATGEEVPNRGLVTDFEEIVEVKPVEPAPETVAEPVVANNVDVQVSPALKPPGDDNKPKVIIGQKKSPKFNRHQPAWEESNPGPGSVVKKVAAKTSTKVKPSVSVKPTSKQSLTAVKKSNIVAPTVFDSISSLDSASTGHPMAFILEREMEYIRENEKRTQSSKVHTLAMKHSIIPSISLKSRNILVSDGENIIIKNIDGGYDIFLGKPKDSPNTLEKVLSTSLSPSGNFAAAVVRSNTTSDSYLDNKISDNQLCDEILLWYNDKKSNRWRFVDGVTLRMGSILRGVACIDWLIDDCLVVAVPNSTGPMSNVGTDGIVVSLIPADKILNCEIAAALRNSCKQLVFRGDMTTFKLLPNQVVSNQVIMALIWFNSKILLVSFAPTESSGTNSAIIWSEDIGPKGPFLSVDVAAATGRVPASATSVVATLDSFGGIKLILLYSYLIQLDSGNNTTLMPTFVETTLPSHSSGHPKTIALSNSDSASTSNNNLCLIIGFPMSIRLFSILFDAKASKSVTATLSLLYKVSISFTPDHIIPLLRQTNSNAPDILVTNGHGYFGFIPTVNNTILNSSIGTLDTVSDNVECVILNSPPLNRVPAVMTVCPDSNILVVVQGGKLILFNTISGVQLPLPSPSGVNNATCITSIAGLFAVGSTCGRVSVYDSTDMRVIRSISNSYHESLAKKVTKGGSATVSKKSPAVSNVLFLCNGDIIVALYDDGTVTATIVKVSGGQSKIMSKLFSKTLKLSLASCAYDDTLFAIHDGNSSVEMYRVSYSSPKSNINQVITPILELIIPKIALVPFPSDTTYAGPIMKIKGMHMIKYNKWVLITLISYSIDSVGNRINYLMSGAIDVTLTGSKQASLVPKEIYMHPRICLGPNVYSHSFKGSTCALALHTGICTINVKNAAEAITVSPTSFIPPLTLDEACIVCEPLLTSDTSCVTISNWQNSVVSLSNVSDINLNAAYDSSAYTSIPHPLELYAYKSNKSSLYKLQL